MGFFRVSLGFIWGFNLGFHLGFHFGFRVSAKVSVKVSFSYFSGCCLGFLWDAI